MKELLNGFREYEIKLNKSEKSIDIYVKEAELFIKNYNINSIEDLKVLEDTDFLTNVWLNNMIDKFAVATVNKKKASLSVFSSYLVLQDIIKDNKIKQIENLKNDHKKIDVYTDEDIQRIFDYMDNKIKEDKFQRHIDKQVYIINMTAIKLLYKNALRISEAVSIETNDFNLDNGNKFYIHGKGGHGKVTRFNSFSSDMIDLINECLQIRSNIKIKEGNEKYFFISPISKSKITEASLRKFLKNILKTLDIQYNSPAHDFRHSKCSELISKGVEVSKVATFAGHSSAKTTETYYVHGVEETMEDLVNL